MRAVLAGVAVAVVAVAGASARPQGGAPLAYVAAEDEDRLVVVNLCTRAIVRRITVANGPHNVAASFDCRVVAVTSPSAGRVTIYDGS